MISTIGNNEVGSLPDFEKTYIVQINTGLNLSFGNVLNNTKELKMGTALNLFGVAKLTEVILVDPGLSVSFKTSPQQTKELKTGFTLNLSYETITKYNYSIGLE